MRRSEDGREALSNFLSGKWDLDQIYNSALEFGDSQENREAEWSLGVSYEVLGRIFEMDDGFLTFEQFEAILSSITGPR